PVLRPARCFPCLNNGLFYVWLELEKANRGLGRSSSIEKKFGIPIPLKNVRLPFTKHVDSATRTETINSQLKTQFEVVG
ncbi:MAG: hypothetical protein ACK54I_07520, partial [Planctomycetota bacterium]